MAICTGELSVNDLSLEGWKILDLRPLGNPVLERHIFGYSRETGYYQLSSRILEETESWVRTRSRHYFKVGPAKTGWVLEEKLQFIDMLQCWGLTDDQVTAQIDAHD